MSAEENGIRAGNYRTIVFNDTDKAVAIAARLTMTHSAFFNLPFGGWMQVLVAQAARGHTRFFLDDHDCVVGFFGFALTDRARAEAWTFHNEELPDAACVQGDCIIVNAWVASKPDVNAVMVDEVRSLGKTAAYYKRFHFDGRIRLVRLPIKDPRFPMRAVLRRRYKGSCNRNGDGSGRS